MRKSPRRHQVKSHLREGHRVRPYTRGHGLLYFLGGKRRILKDTLKEDLKKFGQDIEKATKETGLKEDEVEAYEDKGYDTKNAWFVYVGEEGAILVVPHKKNPKDVYVDWNLHITDDEDAKHLVRYLKAHDYTTKQQRK